MHGQRAGGPRPNVHPAAAAAAAAANTAIAVAADAIAGCPGAAAAAAAAAASAAAAGRGSTQRRGVGLAWVQPLFAFTCFSPAAALEGEGTIIAFVIRNYCRRAFLQP